MARSCRPTDVFSWLAARPLDDFSRRFASPYERVQVYGVLFLDGIVFMVALFTVKYACEICLRKRKE